MQNNQEATEITQQLIAAGANPAHSGGFTEINWFKNRRDNVLKMYRLTTKELAVENIFL